MTSLIEPTKENTLSLVIKQSFFDEIKAGKKKCEYREIKDTTYRKYLECDEEGNPYFTEGVMDINDPLCGDIYIWNNGVYPYIPKDDIFYLNLAVGYKKNRATMTVEVLDVTFEPLCDNNNNPARFTEDENGVAFSQDGELCFWQIVYHLGNIVELNEP